MHTHTHKQTHTQYPYESSMHIKILADTELQAPSQ